jgi:esterase/lipase superfamily enzyme
MERSHSEAKPRSRAYSRRWLLNSTAAAAITAFFASRSQSVAAEIPVKKATERAQFAEPQSIGRRSKEEVFFVTDRNETGSINVEQQFGTERGPLAVGVATVAITRGLSRPIMPPKVKSTRSISRSALFPIFRSKPERPRDALLYVPGFNNSFAHAVATAAQLKADIETPAGVFAFSWPSQESFWSYGRDEVEVAWASQHLTALMLDLLRSADVAQLQIICHSLGTRAVVSSLKAIHTSPHSAHLKDIKDIVLVAADIDQDTMDADFLPVLKAHGMTATLYASQKDWAMSVADFWRGGRNRVGSLDGRVYLREGVDTIDVTAVDSSPWGHSAVFESRRIASDLHYALNHRLRADQRHGLRPVHLAQGVIWQMLP